MVFCTTASNPSIRLSSPLARTYILYIYTFPHTPQRTQASASSILIIPNYYTMDILQEALRIDIQIFFTIAGVRKRILQSPHRKEVISPSFDNTAWVVITVLFMYPPLQHLFRSCRKYNHFLWLRQKVTKSYRITWQSNTY